MAKKICFICGGEVGFWSERIYEGETVCSSCYHKQKKIDDDKPARERSLGSAEAPPTEQSSLGSTFGAWGILLLAAGFLAATVGLFMEVTAPGSSTVNLDLMDRRLIILGAAAVLFLIGAGLVTVGLMSNQGEEAKAPLEDGASSADTRLCPYCAEEVKVAAIVCKHCQRDILLG